jgi:hypothetical protein
VVIVAVVVAWVASAHLSRWLPLPSPATAGGAAVPAPRTAAAATPGGAAPADGAAKKAGPDR